jgi:hypothetical protein
MEDINIYLSRILSGTYLFIYKNQTLKLKYPDINVKYLADLYATQEYQKNKFNEWILEDDIFNYLIMTNLWNPLVDKEFKELPKKIEDYKVQLYQNELNPKNQKSIRRILKDAQNKYDHLYHIRHSFDHLTAQGYANLSKNHYILSESIFDSEDNKIFHRIDDIDFILFNEICSLISNNTIPAYIFRKIARSELWRNYWIANKDFLFGKPTIEWTDEQKNLVVITKMYDNAYEHPECPGNNILEDDDMFDGWMISIRRENEKDKTKRRTEKKFGDKLNKAGEIFLMAESKEEAQNIYSLNNPLSRNIIKEREIVLKQNNDFVKDADLPDVQRNLQMQQIQQIKEKHKR